MHGYLVIGAGPLGLGVGYSIWRIGKKAQFFGRTGPVTVNCLIHSRETLNFFSASIKPWELENLGAVFVATKAYDLIGAVSQHAQSLPPGVPIIYVGNGAVEEELLLVAEKFPQFVWRIGFATLAVSAESNQEISLRNEKGQVVWGPLDAAFPQPTAGERELLESQGDASKFVWQPQARYGARKKWLFNTVINTLSAAHQWQCNGLLLTDIAALKETFLQAFTLGEELWGRWEHSQEVFFKELIELIAATADNENSMVRDLRLGRRTESAFLAGKAVGRFDYPKLKTLHAVISTGSGE